MGFIEIFISEIFIVILLTILLLIFHSMHKKKKQLNTQHSVIQALGSTYTNIFVVNFETKSMKFCQMSSYINKNYGRYFQKNNYDKNIALYIQKEVYKDDVNVFSTISTTEKVKNLLKDKKETSFSYRSFRNGEIIHYQCEILQPEPENQEAVIAFKIIDEFLWENQYNLELNNIQENMNSGQWFIDFDENSKPIKCSWTESARLLLGFSRHEDLPENLNIWSEILHPEDREKALDEFWKTINSKDCTYKYNVVHRLRTKTNDYRWFRSTGTISRRKDGSVQRFAGIIIDINEAQINEIWLNKLLNIQSKQLGLLSSLAGIYHTVHLVDLEKSVFAEISTTRTVKSFTEQQDLSIADMMRSIMEKVVRKDFLEQVLQFTDMNTLQERIGNNKTISMDFISQKKGWVRARFIAIENNQLNLEDETDDQFSGVKQCFFVTQIIEAEKQKEEELMKMSNTDEITSFLNRHAYETDLTKLEKIPELPGMYIITMDLNGLKVVNDTLGHDAGDELIKGAASCIKRAFGDFGSIYRTGGDEFQAIILIDDDITPIMDNFRQIQQGWHGERVKEISISIGVASKKEFPNLSLRELSKIADERMYKDKSLFYSKKGTDRRGQQNATSIISNTYISIVNVNLGSDTFKIIKNAEYGLLDIINQNDLFSTLINKIVEKDYLDDETKVRFKAFFNAETIKAVLSGSKAPLQFACCFNKTKTALFEIIPDTNFSELNPAVYICFKLIDIPCLAK